jgi:hypothetical protein
MSRKKRLHHRFVLTLLLVLCIVHGAEAQSRRFMGHREFRPVTRNLPAIERVELLKLKIEDNRWYGKIEAVKSLQGAEAQKVAALWRRQTFNQNMGVCHEPNYAIKFYAKGRLLAYASICWSCNNIYFITPKSKRTQSFAGYDSRGEQLSEIFRLAFAQTE